MKTYSELLDAARAATGLTDFGNDSFREGLEILVRSLREEAHLNANGETYLHRTIVGLLGQRLQIEEWYRRHPEIDDEKIAAPLFGVGLPRTGSTALSFLLAEDPNARSLRLWEANRPCPPPSTIADEQTRLDATAAEVRERNDQAPRRQQLVPASATGPTECLSLMALDFKSDIFQAFCYIPSYTRWFMHRADLTRAYLYERRVLKLLQWGFPTRPWRLKTPTHLLFLDHLDRAFPDARFVMTHRDPAQVMVSVADLYSTIWHSYSTEIDKSYIGALNVEYWTTGMERALTFRAGAADDRFFDIDFRAMQHDPIGEVTRLYGWLGEPVTDEFANLMHRWWSENAEKREANTHPDPADFGLDLDRIRPLFADYTARAARWTAR